MIYLDSIEAMRGDIAELRHAVQRLDEKLMTLIKASDEKMMTLIKASEEKLTGLIGTSEARTAAAIEKGLKEQTRFFFLAWSVVLASIIGLYAR
ncbi:MAG: hypothetical protein ACRENU_16530 [Gemmatimonadaceae bacterium]